MASRSRKKPSTPRLSDLAQHVVTPSGIVSTGWPAVAAKCAELGIAFRRWQPDVGRIILAKRADGKYASTIGGTGLSIPRQVGKTFIVGAIVFALCLLFPNLTVIWTAHRLRTAEETFGKMQAFAKRKGIRPHIAKIVLGSGDEEIRFRNGSRILFGARERGFGRGFDEVDVLIFDEAQILTDSALDDMIPATNQSRQAGGALLLFMGTPPKPGDPSEVWLRMRGECLSGEDEDTGWIEFGADEGYEPTPAPGHLTKADWQQVAKANPSFPHDTPREAILRMRKKLGPESFKREGLGIYDQSGPVSVFAPGSWADAELVPGERPAARAIGLSVSADLAFASIGSIGQWDDETYLIGAVDRFRGVEVMAAEAARIFHEHHPAVVVDGKAPQAETLISALRDAGVPPYVVSSQEYAEGCKELYAAIRDGLVTHMADDELERAVHVATKRKVGDGGWAWARGKSLGDISMLEGVTLAWIGRDLDYDIADSFG